MVERRCRMQRPRSDHDPCPLPPLVRQPTRSSRVSSERILYAACDASLSVSSSPRARPARETEAAGVSEQGRAIAGLSPRASGLRIPERDVRTVLASWSNLEIADD